MTDHDEHNGRPSTTEAEAVAARLRAALDRVDQQVGAITDEHVEQSLTDLLARAGVARPDAGAPTIEDLELDLVRATWEVEFATAGTGPAVRGEAGVLAANQADLRDDTFQWLRGSHRQRFDPAPKVAVSVNEDGHTLSATVIVAGLIAPGVESVTVIVPTSAGTVRIPLAIDRGDVKLVGTARADGPVPVVPPRVRVEVIRHGR